jgi:16S rRNA (uracil1498-N3)-methyltransferase
VVLGGDETHHALDVLRVSPTETISVFDGEGVVASCAIEGVEEGRLVARILEKRHEPRPRPEIALYQAAPKGAKVDAIVERSAELGIGELLVFQSERTVVRWPQDKVERLAERWRGKARAVAKQSRNPYVMRTGPVVPWREMVDRVGREPRALVLWEDASVGLRDVLPANPERVAMVVGPEGGLSAEEADGLRAAGAALVSLGPRIFRTEMASVAATAALLWHYRLIG